MKSSHCVLFRSLYSTYHTALFGLRCALSVICNNGSNQCYIVVLLLLLITLRLCYALFTWDRGRVGHCTLSLRISERAVYNVVGN